jgi:hypothetical protein
LVSSTASKDFMASSFMPSEICDGRGREIVLAAAAEKIKAAAMNLGYIRR